MMSIRNNRLLTTDDYPWRLLAFMFQIKQFDRHYDILTDLICSIETINAIAILYTLQT